MAKKKTRRIPVRLFPTVLERSPEKVNLVNLLYGLDVELEHHFHMPISRLKALSLTGYSFRQKASRVLGRILQENRDGNLIVALPPSGLCDWYRKVIKKHGAIVIALSDTAANILQRIVFYDDDSNRIEKELDERGRALYLREIRKDIGYFRRFHGKANLHVAH